MSMIERVARAIAKHCYAVIDGHDDCREWDFMPVLVQDVYIRAARDAIEAMKIPTPEMLAQFGIHRSVLTANYQAMIDAALSDAA